MRHTMMAAVCMTIAAAPALAQPQPAGLPQGLSLTETAEGTALAVGDKTVYRLILDRMRRRYKGFVSFDIASARCGEECTRYWAPLPPPAEFKATGNWTIVNADSKPQLAYKGDPLYIFRGRSFEPLMRSRTAPSYFSGYTAKPGLTLDGVPLGTIYWQPARYDAPHRRWPHPAESRSAGSNPHSCSWMLAIGNFMSENRLARAAAIAMGSRHLKHRWLRKPWETGDLSRTATEPRFGPTSARPFIFLPMTRSKSPALAGVRLGQVERTR